MSENLIHKQMDSLMAPSADEEAINQGEVTSPR